MPKYLDFASQLASLRVLIGDGLSAFNNGDLASAEKCMISSLLGVSRLSYNLKLEPSERKEVDKTRHDNLCLLATVEGRIGSERRRQGKLLDAVKYALRAAKRHRLTNEFGRRALYVENAANAYLQMQRADRAEPLYRDCLDTLVTLNYADKATEVKFMVQQIQRSPPLSRMVELRRAETTFCVGAEQLLKCGEMKKVLSQTERFLALYPESGGAWDMKGQCLASMGQRDESLRCHQKSVQCDPTDPVAFRNLARQLDALGRYIEALEQQQNACDLAPEDGEILCGFALYLLKSSDKQEINEKTNYLLHCALLFLDEAIEFAPQWGTSYVCKAQALLTLGFIEPADKALKHAIAIGFDQALIAPLANAVKAARRRS